MKAVMKQDLTVETLKKIPDVNAAEAKAVAASIAHIGDVATKDDITELRTATKEAIDGLHTEVNQLREETRQAIAELHTEVNQLREETRQAIAELHTEVNQLREETRQAIDGLHTEVNQLKEDIKQLQIKTEKIEARLEQTATKSDLAQLRLEMQALASRQTKQLLGVVVVLLAAVIGF